jgi:hypothetical protein
MTRILLTNDDGIHSEGLQILEAALRDVGDVFVVAPAAEMSGASHSLTLSRPLRIRQIDNRHWSVDGTPTDCVTLALHQILQEDELPDVAFQVFMRDLGDVPPRELWLAPLGRLFSGCRAWRWICGARSLQLHRGGRFAW